MFGPMHRLLVCLFVTALACGDAARTSPARISIVDSIRARRAAALAVRPDTLGARADSLRVLGSPSAPVWIVVVSDFQCPQCRDFARDVLPEIRTGLVARGEARLAMVHFPRDEHFNARFAAHASLCAAGSGRFWEVHDTLFATLPRWDRDPDPQAYFDSLQIAVGVPADVVRDCRQRQRYLRLLTTDIERARASGVREFPAVFVSERLLPASDRSVAGIERAVKRATDARR